MRFHCFSVFSQASCRFERPVANALEQFKQLKPTHEMFDSCRNCGALQEGHEKASICMSICSFSLFVFDDYYATSMLCKA